MKKTQKLRRKVSIVLVALFALFLIFSIKVGFIKTINSDTHSLTETPNFFDTRTSNSPLNLVEIKNKSQKNLILFTASWCGSCLGLVTDLKNYSVNYPNINIYIADLEQNREVISLLQTGTIPSINLIDSENNKSIPEVTSDKLAQILSDFDKIGVR